MFFEKKGVELIAKSAETLRKQYDPTSTPPDIARWINHKFTYIVKVLYKKSTRNMDPSFEVVMIKERHGKQATLRSIVCTGSMTSSIDTSDLPPLVPITSIKKKDQVQQKNYIYYVICCCMRF
jgi:replication factor A1